MVAHAFNPSTWRERQATLCEFESSLCVDSAFQSSQSQKRREREKEKEKERKRGREREKGRKKERQRRKERENEFYKLQNPEFF